MPREAFVTFVGGDSRYEEVSDVLEESVAAFSSRPLFKFVAKGKCAEYRKFYRWHLLSKIVDRDICLLDCDTVLTRNADAIWDFMPLARAQPCPLATLMPDNPRPHKELLARDVSLRPTMPFVYISPSLICPRHKPFLRQVYLEKKEKARKMDNDCYVRLLWRYKCRAYLPTLHASHLQFRHENSPYLETMGYHGEKDPQKAKQILEALKKGDS